MSSDWMDNAAQMSRGEQEDSGAQTSNAVQTSSGEQTDSAEYGESSVRMGSERVSRGAHGGSGVQTSNRQTGWRGRSRDEVITVTVPKAIYSAVFALLRDAEEQLSHLPPITRAARLTQIAITRNIITKLGNGGIPINQVRSAMRTLHVACHAHIVEDEQIQKLTSAFQL